MEFKDYYAVMSVEKSATPEDIKRAHRKLARKYHPDVSKEKDAEARFKELAEAYDVLKDPEKRAAYDRFVLTTKRGNNFSRRPTGQARNLGAAVIHKVFKTAMGKTTARFLIPYSGVWAVGRVLASRAAMKRLTCMGKTSMPRFRLILKTLTKVQRARCNYGCKRRAAIAVRAWMTAQLNLLFPKAYALVSTYAWPHKVGRLWAGEGRATCTWTLKWCRIRFTVRTATTG